MKAYTDLNDLINYIEADSPEQAERISQIIENAPLKLLEFPRLDRIGRRLNTFELVLAPLPYIMVYSVQGRNIRIVRIFHGKQNWQ